MLGQTTKLTLGALTTAALVGSANAATLFDVKPYHAYSDTAQGAGTISPFSSVYGAISQQDPDGGVGETTSLHDFRGLAAIEVFKLFDHLDRRPHRAPRRSCAKV